MRIPLCALVLIEDGAQSVDVLRMEGFHGLGARYVREEAISGGGFAALAVRVNGGSDAMHQLHGPRQEGQERRSPDAQRHSDPEGLDQEEAERQEERRRVVGVDLTEGVARHEWHPESEREPETQTKRWIH